MIKHSKERNLLSNIYASIFDPRYKPIPFSNDDFDVVYSHMFFNMRFTWEQLKFMFQEIPFAGSGLIGYAMGFALKKILKWMLIIIGFLAGMFFVGIQLLQKYGYVSMVNWDKLGNDASTQIQHLAANIDVTNVHSLFHTLGLPISGGLGLGVLAGFVRTR